MRRRVAAFGLALVGCAGSALPGREAAPPASESDGDRSFVNYAAAHGIATLNGGSGESTESYAPDGLRLEHVEKDRPIKLDGVLGEWPPLAKAAVASGRSDAHTAMAIALQYDETALYVAADITDNSFTAGSDHVSLLLAVPQPGGTYGGYAIEFYAGKPGETEGSVRLGRRGAVAGAKIVEAPSGAGYSIEASVPWSALSEARSTRVGIHGIARYVHGDAVVATGPGDLQHPGAMPWIPSEPELSLIDQLLTPKGLAKTAPVADVIADLTGDGVRERVAVFERYLTICGTSYLGGTGFFYRDLGGELVKLEIRDVTGRGKPDVVVRRRASAGDGTREYLEVLSALDANSEPRVTFAHEIAVRQSDREIDNAVHLARGEIEVSVEPPTRWDAASYDEPIASDVEPILLPWGGVKSQVWRWDGSRFAKARETFQKPQLLPGTVLARKQEGEDDAPPRPPEPPTPKVVRGSELSADLLAAYRRDRGIGADVRAKADLEVQVAGDERPERVLLVGRDLVVFGPGFKGGTGYAYLTLGEFAEASDIHDLSARDLTGDGDADLIVRGVRHFTEPRGVVESELLFVYEVNGETISRVFGIESGRQQGKKRVQGLVQFIPSPGGKSFDVLAAPGRATGWTVHTYPWAQAQPGSGSDVEPLLLPWSGIASVRYAWNGSQFVKTD